MTTTTTLTDRYVDATLRRLPADKRPDIERELRAAIADALDAHLEAGTDPAEAEVAVLTELGDPTRLAAGYADRPLHLIGPARYLDYTRLLKALLVTVVPAVAAIVGFVQVLEHGLTFDVIGTVVTAAFTAGLHVAFWTTLLFAGLDRIPDLRWPSAQPWTPAALPEPPSRRMRYGELIAETVALVLFTTLLLLAPVVSPETDAAGQPINVLNPWLWDTGIVYVYIVLVVASLVFSYAKYYAPRNTALVVVGMLVDLAPPFVTIWLAANNRVLNPAFIEAVGWSPSAAEWIDTGLIVLSIFTILHTISEAIRRARS